MKMWLCRVTGRWHRIHGPSSQCPSLTRGRGLTAVPLPGVVPGLCSAQVLLVATPKETGLGDCEPPWL